MTELTPEAMLANIEARLNASHISTPEATPSISKAVLSDATLSSSATEETGETEEVQKKQPPSVLPKRKHANASTGAESSTSNATPADAPSSVAMPDAQKESGSLRCPACHLAVLQDGVIVVADGHTYHKACVVCAQCNKPVPNETAGIINGKLYCNIHLYPAQVRAL